MRKRIHWARAELLRSIPMFEACTDEELHAIDSLLDDVEVAPGEVLIHEGRPGRESFIVVRGEARVTLRGTDVGSIGPGGIFGEMALLDNEPRPATVTATTPMQLLVLAPRGFFDLLRRRDVAHRVLKTAFDRLRAIQGAPTYKSF